MNALTRRLALCVILAAMAAPVPHAAGPETGEQRDTVRVRPAMLAGNIEGFAGTSVEVLDARAVGTFGPRVLVIDTAMRLPPLRGYRDRILVMVEQGEISVDPELLIGSTVRVSGVARTLLGMRLSREVPWPAELDRERIERLEIHAAVLATSIRTADGVELTTRTARSTADVRNYALSDDL